MASKFRSTIGITGTCIPCGFLAYHHDDPHTHLEIYPALYVKAPVISTTGATATFRSIFPSGPLDQG